MGRACKVRRASVDDWPRIASFLARTYGPEAPFKGRPRWDWQFRNNPFHLEGDGQPSVWIALDGARVLGQIAVQDGRFRIGPREYPAGWILDVMVDPAARGAGLGHAIHAAIAAERATLVTLTMAPATRRIAERAGALTLGPVREYVRPAGPLGETVRHFLEQRATTHPRVAGLLRLFAASRVGPALVGGAMRTASWLRARAAEPSGDIEEVWEAERFAALGGGLWARLCNRFPAAFVRDARFLEWRFGAAPDLAYRRFILRRGGDVAGWVVTRSAHPAEAALGVLVDLLADPRDEAALDTLVAHGLSVLAPAARYVRAGASHPAFRAALERAGFLHVRTHRPTVVCSDPQLRQIIALTRDLWHVTKADHDWDQVHPEPRAIDARPQTQSAA